MCCTFLLGVVTKQKRIPEYQATYRVFDYEILSLVALIPNLVNMLLGNFPAAILCFISLLEPTKGLRTEG